MPAISLLSKDDPTIAMIDDDVPAISAVLLSKDDPTIAMIDDDVPAIS